MLNPVILQLVLIVKAASTHVKDLAFGFIEPYEIHLGPLLKPVWVSLDGIQYGVLTVPHSLVSSVNLLRMHSTPLSMSLLKILKSISPSTDPWGTPLITDLHRDIEPLTTILWS